MKKMLIADNTNVNALILHEIFGAQYELLQTESSDGAFRLLMQYRDDMAVVIINEEIARRISPETSRTLRDFKVFDNIPIIIILNKDSDSLRPQMIHLPYSDVINSPVNPLIAKRRVANLVELFSNKSELEKLVSEQTKKILEQNDTLKLQQKKINSINNDMLDTLSTVIEYRDVESGRHIHRIRKFTELLLRALAAHYPKYNLTEEKIQLITSASSIHDIGKIAIPDSILLSPRRLTYEEFKIMKTHTIKGCEILEQLDTMERNEYFSYCYDICRYHHEKWDGLGYPDGLAGDEIPIWAQVVSVADCYDALTSERPYKSAFTHEQAVEMIRGGACGAFSDEMMDCFGRVLSDFKILAEEYSDAVHADSGIADQTCRKFADAEGGDHSKDIYLKMDRDDLISVIEHQKNIISDTHRRECEALYRSSDYVFEFDLRHDMLHERSGSFKQLCGYVPKNYEEAVTILSDVCTDEFKSEFVRTFRMESMMEAVENDADNCSAECLMDVGEMEEEGFRCTAVPLVEDGELSRIFFTIVKLESAVVSSAAASDEHDPVTGLNSYNSMQNEIDDFLSHTGKNGYHCLVLIDLDNFREINRQTSYRFGNDILCDVADELRCRVPDNTILGRVEDDNFLVFVKDCPNMEERERIVEELFRCVHKTYIFNDDKKYEIGASVGVSAYPENGSDFESIFGCAGRAVELVKLNGKNMYLFYNEAMNENWEIGGSAENTDSLSVVEYTKYFIPVADPVSGRVMSYDLTEYTVGKDGMLHELKGERSEVLTAMSLSSMKRLIGAVYSMEQEKLELPKLSIYTVFDAGKSETVLKAIDEMLEEYPVKCSNLCLMLSHETIASMSINDLVKFCTALKKFGFGIGIYNIGGESINIKCFAEKLFDKVALSSAFISGVADGIYPIELPLYMASYFSNKNVMTELPAEPPEELLELFSKNSQLLYCIQKNEMMTLDDFVEQIKMASVAVEYPVLSHEDTELVLSEHLYDEILEQTGTFILEWTPRFDSIKLSGSFGKMYGYIPETDNFMRNIKDCQFFHADDVRKLLERMNSARSENAESESFIRIYNAHDDSYVWNKVRFVSIRNSTGVPVRIIAVFVDVSDEHDTSADDRRKDRTDFITNLYNKRATENKIKRYIYDEGSSAVNALIVVEICGFDTLEDTLGTVFANAVLKESAEKVRELFRDSDIIGRNSGNRFTIFVKNIAGFEKIKEKAEQVCNILSSKYQSDTGDISIFGKAGISIFPANGLTYDELYSEALKALYYAKHSIKQSVALAADTDTKRLP